MAWCRRRSRHVLVSCLKFSPSVAGWMEEQVWHSEQKITVKNDGSLVMKFPVADFRELRRKILSYGAEVKVISPQKLAVEIREEIERMGKVYKKTDVEKTDTQRTEDR